MGRIAAAASFALIVSGCPGSRAPGAAGPDRGGAHASADRPHPPLTPLATAGLGATASDASVIAPGLVHWRLRFAHGPWVVNVLDVDRAACWSPRAVKGGAAAVGRSLTSTLVQEARRAGEVNGNTTDIQRPAVGVNADFFRFVPPGIPQSAHIALGEVISGPSSRPVLALDSLGRLTITTLSDTGYVVVGRDTLPVAAWNRMAPTGLAVFDGRWGSAADTASATVEVAIAVVPEAGAGGASAGAVMSEATAGPGDAIPSGFRRGSLRGPVERIDTVPEGVPPGPGRVVLVAGARAPAALRGRLRNLRPGADTAAVHVALQPFHPREAVGGFPVLVADSALLHGIDSAGGRGFGPVRHPRTALGLAAGGRRLLLVTVDGRQPGYSAGMTLRELAELLLQFGATDALNLDGGGSTTMVLGAANGTSRILNQPSDSTGERPVANALAVVSQCDWPGGGALRERLP